MSIKKYIEFEVAMVRDAYQRTKFSVRHFTAGFRVASFLFFVLLAVAWFRQGDGGVEAAVTDRLFAVIIPFLITAAILFAANIFVAPYRYWRTARENQDSRPVADVLAEFIEQGQAIIPACGGAQVSQECEEKWGAWNEQVSRFLRERFGQSYVTRFHHRQDLIQFSSQYDNHLTNDIRSRILRLHQFLEQLQNRDGADETS